MIHDSRKNVALRSVEFYIDAINDIVASRQANIDFDVASGSICSDGIDYTIDYSSYTSKILSMEKVISIMGITSIDVKKIVTDLSSIGFSESNLTTTQVKSKSNWLPDIKKLKKILVLLQMITRKMTFIHNLSSYIWC